MDASTGGASPRTDGGCECFTIIVFETVVVFCPLEVFADCEHIPNEVAGCNNIVFVLGASLCFLLNVLWLVTVSFF